MTTVIAHRGASAHAPEHTIAAFDLAAELGAEIELDLRACACGDLVAFHDDTVERTARAPDGRCVGRVGMWTREDLRGLEVGSWFGDGFAELRPLDLDEVLERYAGCTRLHLELKETGGGVEERVAAAIARHGASTRVAVMSFDAAALERMRAADPYVELLLIFDSGVPARRIERRLAGLSGTVDGVAPHWSSVDRRLVAAAHARQLFVRTYTVNDEAQVARLAAMGVDGIVTDAPDRAQAALAAGERVAA